MQPNKTKLRAWLKESKMMQYFCLGDVMYEAGGYGYATLAEMEIMLPLGLFDKKGIEIFEGDSIKDSFGKITTVKWDKDDSQFKFASGHPVDSIEIIGNKWENPELN